MKRDLIRLAFRVGVGRIDPKTAFWSERYLRHNHRRLEHLVSLQLDLSSKTVLEVGAGVGDHTSFFLDRNCQVITSDGRPSNVTLLAARYGHDARVTVLTIDLDIPDDSFLEMVDVVYCYGTLYHLKSPADALAFLGNHCREILLLETCVSSGTDVELHPCDERFRDPTQAMSGTGCRPTRPWVFSELKRHFEHVYMPRTQPWHEEFPLDWTVNPPTNALTRAVFIASRNRLDNPSLVDEVPMQQIRH